MRGTEKEQPTLRSLLGANQQEDFLKQALQRQTQALRVSKAGFEAGRARLVDTQP